jgi:hypothetical protein
MMGDMISGVYPLPTIASGLAIKILQGFGGWTG